MLPHIEGLGIYYTIYVLYYLDRIKPEERVTSVYPRGDVTKPKRGVLATRSPLRYLSLLSFFEDLLPLECLNVSLQLYVALQ